VEKSAPSSRRSLSLLTRSRWSVLQTGLITTASALFGVWVLANRIDDTHVVNLYVLRYLPVGAMLIGLLAGSGYALGAWWFGVRVDRGLLAPILLLQFVAYATALYVEFSSLDLVYQNEDGEVAFLTYLNQATLSWAPLEGGVRGEPIGRWGYLLRAGEAGLFMLAAVPSTLVLLRRPACEACGGLLQRRVIGAVPADKRAQVVDHLRAVADRRNAKAFRDALQLRGVLRDRTEASEPVVDLCVDRCLACGSGYITSAPPHDRNHAADPNVASSRTPVAAELAAQLFNVPADSPGAGAL
jgi:hypothetical protein